MTTSQVMAFVKFFREESHADQFVKGMLYMNRLRYFQQLENSEADDGRPDPHEAVATWHQPDRIELTLNFRGFSPIKIGSDDLAGPVSTSLNFYSDMHLFCMSTLSIPDPGRLEGDHGAVQSQLQAAFQIDTRCLNFGPYAVLVRADKFITQLRRKLKQHDLWYRAALVEYYDHKTFHGEFAEENIPFRKQVRFSYQKEYRVCLLTATAGDNPITFDVGDMSAFAFKVRSVDLNPALKVTLNTRDA